MNKVIEYIIGAKDATGNAIKSALFRLKSFAASVGSNLMNIKAGFEMLGSAANKAMTFMRKAFAFETMTVQFKTLIGNMDEARDHMKMLQELGDTPPFSLEEFAAASRALMVMTDGALGFRSSLELIGDAAAATGQPIQNLAHEVGRAYAIIRDGQPLTRATMSLRNMGVLTPEVAQKLQDLQDAGADEEYANGGGFLDQIKAGGRAAKQMWNDTWNPQEDPNEKAHEEDVRQRAKERQADDAAKKEQKRIEEAAKIKASLEEGQRKIDERNAEAAAKKEWEEYEKGLKKAAEDEERARIEAERAIAAERQRLWNEDLKQRQADLTAAQSAEADAQAALSAAQSNEAQAWGLYRNKDQWKAQLAEEKANAEAEAQFEKDFEHLKRFRKGWRTNTNLSEDEEIVRRVGLAREQREAAEDYARQTAEDTARAADALENIEQAISEGSDE